MLRSARRATPKGRRECGAHRHPRHGRRPWSGRLAAPQPPCHSGPRPLPTGGGSVAFAWDADDGPTPPTRGPGQPGTWTSARCSSSRLREPSRDRLRFVMPSLRPRRRWSWSFHRPQSRRRRRSVSRPSTRSIAGATKPSTKRRRRRLCEPLAGAGTTTLRSRGMARGSTAIALRVARRSPAASSGLPQEPAVRHEDRVPEPEERRNTGRSSGRPGPVRRGPQLGPDRRRLHRAGPLLHRPDPVEVRQLTCALARRSL